jgi:hypothetical protein
MTGDRNDTTRSRGLASRVESPIFANGRANVEFSVVAAANSLFSRLNTSQNNLFRTDRFRMDYVESCRFLSA